MEVCELLRHIPKRASRNSFIAVDFVSPCMHCAAPELYNYIAQATILSLVSHHYTEGRCRQHGRHKKRAIFVTHAGNISLRQKRQLGEKISTVLVNTGPLTDGPVIG